MPLFQIKLILIPYIINVKSCVPEVKFLGIFIDPALNSKYHIEKMTRKLATALFFMRCAKNFLNMEAMRYNCTIVLLNFPFYHYLRPPCMVQHYNTVYINNVISVFYSCSVPR
jgi:hypothetical protein